MTKMMNKKANVACLAADAMVLACTIIVPIMHLIVPNKYLDFTNIVIVQDIWLILLALSCFMRSPYFYSNQTKTLEEWAEDYKNVR